PRSHKIGTCVAIQHLVPRQETPWRSLSDLKDETHLPFLRHARQPAAAVSKQESARAHWQFDGTIGSEVATDAGNELSIIQCRVLWIGKTGARLADRFTKAVGRREANAFRRPQCELRFKCVVVRESEVLCIFRST